MDKLSLKSFVPQYIYWEICDSCNLHCKHCFANSNPQKKFFQDKSLLLSKIIEIETKHTVPIRFGGGEPFLHPQIFELLNTCEKNGIPIAITTNGTLLDTERVKQLKTYNLQSLTVSIDGTEKYNDYLRGNGNFIKACNGLVNILNANINASLSFTATAYNYLNLPNYVDYFYRMGVREFYIFRYIPDISARRSKRLELDKKMLMEVTAAIQTIGTLYPDIRLNYEKKGHLAFLLSKDSENSSCKFTRGIMTIKFDGTVVVCAAIPKKLGNIYIDKLSQIYSNIANEIKSINTIPSECMDCYFSNTCRGGCKCYSYTVFGNYNHMDNCCFKNLL